MKKVIAVIPARYESSRFPGKPLALIAGKPMIQRVYEQVKKVDGIAEVLVATDDERIAKCVEAFGGIYAMTGECSCGTERVYEAIKDYDCDIVLNVQGDEPYIKPQQLEQLGACFNDPSVELATLVKRVIGKDELMNPNSPKVIVDKNGDAIYFSRTPIPYSRDIEVTDEYVNSTPFFRHIGLYGYRVETLARICAMPQGFLEKTEKLEQLRWIENGLKIRVAETEFQTHAVDTEEDLAFINSKYDWD